MSDGKIRWRSAQLLEQTIEAALEGDFAAGERALLAALELACDVAGAQTATLVSFARATRAEVTTLSVGSGAGLVEQEISTSLVAPAQSEGETWRAGSLHVSPRLRHRGIRVLVNVPLQDDETVSTLILGLRDATLHDLDIEAIAERTTTHLIMARWCERIGRTISGLQVQREQRSKMVSLIAHDLRGPLSTAKLAAQLLTYDPGEAEARQELAQKIDQNIDRTERMVRDLLDANRVHSGRRLAVRFEKCDLAGVVRDVASELRVVHGDRFVVDVDDDTWGVWDAEKLRRVIWNLAILAVKYGAETTDIHIGVSKNEHHARLIVGPIRASDLAADDERLAPRRELGLALAHGWAEAHGGRVDVGRDARWGHAVVLDLPLDAPRGAWGSPPGEGRVS